MRQGSRRAGCDALAHASEELRRSRESVVAAVKQRGPDSFLFVDVSGELKGDKDLTIVVVTQNGRAVQFASEQLGRDIEVTIETVAGPFSWVLVELFFLYSACLKCRRVARPMLCWPSSRGVSCRVPYSTRRDSPAFTGGTANATDAASTADVTKT